MTAESSFSENIQMYLVDILRLSKQGQPVPLSQLATALSVSPISVNQMCRKLQDEGLLTYVPYKGVSITPSGKGLAVRVLRHHRLWEVFLVDHLRMKWEEAHETACRLEHDTTDEVIERLACFLGHPRVNPRGEPIPAGAGVLEAATTMSLAEMRAGQTGTWAQCASDETSRDFLARAGLRAGATFRVMAVERESMLLEVNGQNIVLSHALAAAAQAIPEGQSARPE
jgi:DtxR family Mn-dependent transcriptional regulator